MGNANSSDNKAIEVTSKVESLSNGKMASGLNSTPTISGAIPNTGSDETLVANTTSNSDTNNKLTTGLESDRSALTGSDVDPITKSIRSTGSGSGSVSRGLLSATSQMKSSVHSNLIRTHHDRDPMRFFDIVSVLGQGSMGSVVKVVKKESAIGGSARSEFVRREHGYCYEMCNKIFPPMVAKMQEFCKPNLLQTDQVNSTRTHNSGINDVYEEENGGGTAKRMREQLKDFDEQLYNSTGSGSIHMLSSRSDGTNSSYGETYETTSKVSHSGNKVVQFQATGGKLSSGRFGGGNKKKLLLSRQSSLINYEGKEEVYYALKSIHLDRCSSKEFQEELLNEVEVLKGLDHPNIVRALETYDYNGRLFLLLELCMGGDLYARDPYTERDAKKIVHCIISAVSYLHLKGVVHRDLKFENICFADTSEYAEVRIIDFGLSQKFAKDEHLHDAVGTVYTMAPELLKGKYDAKVDLWSVGVIAFSLLSSSLPFYGKDRLSVMKKVIKGKYRFSSKRWDTISVEAKEFIHRLLQRDPEKRPTGNEAMELPWLHMDYSLDAAFTMEELDQLDNIQASIECFAGYPILKKLGLMVVAYKSTSQQVGFLRKLFTRFDRYRDGEISFPEFRDALANHYDYTDEELLALHKGIDIDGTGLVHYIEFLAATIEAHGSLSEERLAEAFDRIDDDDSGYISVKNLRDLLGKELPQSYLESIINEADILRDHRVSYAEFLAMWNEEADARMKTAKFDVRTRRKITPGSELYKIKSSTGTATTMSMGSSTSAETLGDASLAVQALDSDDHDDDDIDDHDPQTTDPLAKESPADFYYSQRKFQSVRKVEIDMSKMVEFQPVQ